MKCSEVDKVDGIGGNHSSKWFCQRRVISLKFNTKRVCLFLGGKKSFGTFLNYGESLRG